MRAALFDAVGTLLTPDPPAWVAYHRAALKRGSRRSVLEVQARFVAALGRASGRLATSEEAERRYWRGVVARVLDDVEDAAGAFAELWRHFAEPAHWRLAEGAAALLGRLQDRGVIVGVASNFDARLHAVCEGIPGLSHCRRHISSEIGWRKPALRFFRAIERDLRMSPGELLMVGDDRVRDYEGAIRAGWRAIWLGEGGFDGLEDRILSAEAGATR